MKFSKFAGLSLSSQLFALLLLCVAGERAQAINASSIPVDVRQPDGRVITVRARGDEFTHWYEDADGYAVVAAGGQYVYATLNAKGGLAPTALLVGRDNPRAAGLTKYTRPSSEFIKTEHDRLTAPALAAAPPRSNIAPSGTVKNLVILCRFSDHTLAAHTRTPAEFETIFNTVGGHPVLAPTGSVKDYYKEASYGILTLNSTVIAWVTLPQTEAYYANGSSGLGGSYPANPQGMVRDALVAADGLVNFGQFDMDNDGFVDALTIIHSGYAAETGGGAGNWIWSHRWSLFSLPGGRWTSSDVNGNGTSVKVYDYHTEAALWSTSGTEITRIGVIAHETGHYFGLPDLYDTDNTSEGIGSYCLMANSWGFNMSQRNPPHLSAWCKKQLGWVNPTIIGPGVHNVPRTETVPLAYRITNGFPSTEYLLIENRQPVGFEAIMPQGGLAIWHIDEAKSDNKNEGYPGQAGWPGNNNHLKVALLQADGAYHMERKINRGDAGDVYHGGGVSTIGPGTVPNTQRYQGGTVAATGIQISSISASASNMTFTFSVVVSGILPTITGFNPLSGVAGNSVVITGTNLLGATALRFNGVNAAFTVNSTVQITATVPAGATTGPISVTTPTGTASSVGNFVITTSIANDNFASSKTLPNARGTTNANNVGATKQAGEPNHNGNTGGASIWYSWTAPASGPLTLDTQGSTFDTTLAVYTGAAVNALTAVASDDDSGIDVTSLLTFNTIGGTTYRIAVDGYNGASGNIVLNWNFQNVVVSTNDLFADARIISGSSGTAADNNGNATIEEPEPFHAGNDGGKSLWYRWTAPNSGPATIDTLGSTFDTLLAVYTGSTVDGLTEIASNDDSGSGTLSLVTFTAVAGTTYWIAIDGYFDGIETDSGSITLHWLLTPDNDAFANAQVLSGHALSITDNSVGATKEISEPSHAGNVGGRSLWFRWVAPTNGLTIVSTLGSSYDTLLGVYTGGSVGALTPVASNDDFLGLSSEVTINAINGLTYSIAVDGYNGAEGSIGLSIFVKPPLQIRTQGSAVVLTWPASYTGYTLQSVSAMTGSPVWSNLPPAVITAGSYTVTNPVPPAQKFYRLSR